MSQFVDQIVAELESVATEDRAVNEKRYLKSPESMRHIGVTVPAIRKVAKAFHREQRGFTRDQVIGLTEDLWEPEVHETRMVAIELLAAYRKLLTADDAKLVEQMIDESHTWVYVDNLSTNIMGDLVVRYPELAQTLDRWSNHGNFWLRRAAMLSLLKELRDGEGDFNRFTRYAEPMLHEKEFFIRKAIGWILRDTARKRPEMIVEWLTPRAHLASTLTVREATKHMDKALAESLIAASKTGVAVAES